MKHLGNMKSHPKLIVAPIQIVGELSPQFMLVNVTTTLDVMQEPNLKSVVCQQTKEELVFKMDTVSKQRVLHNLFAKQ